MTLTPEIIAEAGSNHNGNISRAFDLIDLAEEAGATSVKFQFIFANGLYLPKFLEGNRYIANPAYYQRQSEELSESDWKAIWSYASSKSVTVSASVFCERGIELLSKLGSPYVKIASTDLTNHFLIGKACEAFDRIIVSTGMATLAEVDNMVEFVRTNYPQANLNLMHCVSAYPCPLTESNTQRIELLKRCFDLPTGYSDHTAGDISAAMALVQGATFFEKHFTADRNLPGFDHAHALDGEELKSYVKTLHDAAESLIRPSNSISDQEKITKIRARRGIYAARDLPAGHILKSEDLLYVRPSSSFETNDPSELIGQPLSEEVAKFSALSLGDSVKMVSSNWKAAQEYWSKEMLEKGMSADDDQSNEKS